jgi:hypothetical protein
MNCVAASRRVSGQHSLARAASLAGYLGAVIAPVLGDLVRELRSEDRKLTEHLEHLRRRIELLDVRTRGQPEARKVLRRVEIAVASLRAGKK